MSFRKQYISVFVLLLLMAACSLPSAATQTPVPISPTIPLLVVATTPSPLTDTPGVSGEPPTSTAMPPSGTPIAHLPAGQAIKITFIKMLDASAGWAIGGINGSSDHVFSTSDGGQTWRDLTPPEPAPTDPQTAKKAIGFFMNAQQAWVAFSGPDMAPPSQGYLWRTSDGGATWQYSGLTESALYSESYVPSDLAFVDAQHGWMMVHVGAGMNHDYFVLLASNDGGATWQTLISPFADDSGTQSCSKDALVFATPQDGWMTVNCHGVVSTPYFFKTHDGGLTWQSVNLPAPPALPGLFDQSQGYCDMTSPTFLTPTNVDLVLDCTQYTNDVSTKQSFLYETPDGGASWNVYAYPGGPLQFIGASTAFALGRDIQRSTDAGHTWTDVKAVNWDGQFSFIDANTAWVVATDNGQIALVKTVDGGVSWQELKPKVAP